MDRPRCRPSTSSAAVAMAAASDAVWAAPCPRGRARPARAARGRWLPRGRRGSTRAGHLAQAGQTVVGRQSQDADLLRGHEHAGRIAPALGTAAVHAISDRCVDAASRATSDAVERQSEGEQGRTRSWSRAVPLSTGLSRRGSPSANTTRTSGTCQRQAQQRQQHRVSARAREHQQHRAPAYATTSIARYSRCANRRPNITASVRLSARVSGPMSRRLLTTRIAVTSSPTGTAADEPERGPRAGLEVGRARDGHDAEEQEHRDLAQASIAVRERDRRYRRPPPRWRGRQGPAGRARRPRPGPARSTRRAPARRPSRRPAGAPRAGHWLRHGAARAGRSNQHPNGGRTGRWTGSRRPGAATPPPDRRRPPPAGSRPARWPRPAPPAPDPTAAGSVAGLAGLQPDAGR